MTGAHAEEYEYPWVKKSDVKTTCVLTVAMRAHSGAALHETVCQIRGTARHLGVYDK